VPTRAQNTAALIAAAMYLASARPASAQTVSRWDLFGAYAYVRDYTEELDLPAGWTAGGSTRLNRWLSIAAEAGGSHKTVPLIGGDVRISQYSVMAGARASLAVGRLVEFAQIVVGPVHARGNAFDIETRDTHVAGQAGIGLDLALNQQLAVRVQFDLRALPTSHQFRTIAGIVYASR
jgi:hypothetical protein